MARVTGAFFRTMGAFPTLGRAFDEREQEPTPAHVVVISHGLWKSAMAGAAKARIERVMSDTLALKARLQQHVTNGCVAKR